MHVDELFATLRGAGLSHAAWHIADASYGCPTLKYVTEAFVPWWAQSLLQDGLGNWNTRWDCDDFAWRFYVDARWAHYRTRGNMDESISIGVMYYMAGAREEDGTGGGHAINIMVSNDGHISYIEPQRAARNQSPWIELSPHEVSSAWFINF